MVNRYDTGTGITTNHHADFQGSTQVMVKTKFYSA